MTQLNNIIKVTLLMLCISALNVFAQKDDENQLQATCCESISIEAVPVPDKPCCLEIRVSNLFCYDAILKINKVYGDEEVNVYKDTLDGRDYFSHIVCAETGDNELKIIVRVTTLNGSTFCTPDTFMLNDKCCECPETIDDIFVTEVIPGKCENGCQVRHWIKFRKEYQNCFRAIKFESSKFPGNNGEGEYSESGVDKYLDQFDACLKKNEKYSYTFTLIGHDGKECKYTDSLHCISKPIDSLKLCVPDCEESPWVSVEEKKFELKDCPGCVVNVAYTYRKACKIWQDLQIARIEFLTEKCSKCDVERLYSMIAKAIIKENDMEFEPKKVGDCSTIWRIANGSCWAEWFYYSENNNHIIDTIRVLEVCLNNICCLQRMKVCRDKENNITITPFGSIITSEVNCKDVEYQIGNASLNCFPACDWLGKINGSSGNDHFKKVETNLRVDYDNSYGLNTGIQDNILSVLIKTPKSCKAEVKVYDVSGKEIINESSEISTGTINTLQVGLGNLQSGNYIFAVIVDGITLKSQKFNINK